MLVSFSADFEVSDSDILDNTLNLICSQGPMFETLAL